MKKKKQNSQTSHDAARRTCDNERVTGSQKTQMKPLPIHNYFSHYYSSNARKIHICFVHHGTIEQKNTDDKVRSTVAVYTRRCLQN